MAGGFNHKTHLGLCYMELIGLVADALPPSAERDTTLANLRSSLRSAMAAFDLLDEDPLVRRDDEKRRSLNECTCTEINFMEASPRIGCPEHDPTGLDLHE